MIRPLLLLVLWVGALCGPALVAAGRPTDYFVAPAPAGDDAHDGSAAAPFATFERARQAVRETLAGGRAPADIVVTFQPGIYELAAPVRFDAADSGRGGHVVTYRAAPDARVILSGGRRVTSWRRVDAATYAAEVGHDADFRQLWIGERRAIRARHPNVGETFTLTTEKAADGFDVPRANFGGAELRPDEVEMSVLIAWMHKRLRISRVTGDGDTVRAVINPLEWDAVTRQPQGDRRYEHRAYWLENAAAFLDAPGEFFLDRPTGTLRYRPRDGENLATAVVIRPVLENLIVLAGTPAAPVHHLRFEGFTFAHTGWTRPSVAGFVDVQANSLVPAQPGQADDPQYRHNQRKDRIPAAFQAHTADHVVLRRNRFLHLGGTGVMFTGGGDDNAIEENAFVDLAAGGIEIGEDAARPNTPRLFPRRNRVANNFLAHLGQDYFGSVAILGYYTDALEIAHNETVGLPYTAISVGWGWGQPPAPPDARANRITHNRVQNFMRRLDDGGGIYTTDRQPGSEIAFNVIAGMVTPDPGTKAGGALYPDQFTSGFHIHDNVVTDASRWLYIWNPNIRGNRVTANYADTSALRNDGTDNQVEPAVLLRAGAWPAEANTIAAAAGLEPRAAGVRETALSADDVFVDPTSVDFRGLRGHWSPMAASGGAVRLVANDVDAIGQWLPVIPRSGRYEVAVWREPGDPAARYVLQSQNGRTEVPVAAAGERGWTSLGQTTWAAGLSGEVSVTRADKTAAPLPASPLRFRPLNPR
ncbi:right-handed parallel beta-helix repeat-containing protein [Opitutus sp. ER46]|uniref:right-handed parallel beta-helix repeat-containing protein n=1 Tax=Opitutus sp. ER46 TaxID=2161864 RepID=UPI000D2F9D87|nr:right-handed parallel beta-helix repeat-containing protein [Opitutus sp. ER46]PTX90959.1 hypothetical protein DB354_20120 [Opitutus sp. ER46]